MNYPKPQILTPEPGSASPKYVSVPQYRHSLTYKGPAQRSEGSLLLDEDDRIKPSKIVLFLFIAVGIFVFLPLVLKMINRARR